MKRILFLLLTFCVIHSMAAVEQSTTFDFTKPTELNATPPITNLPASETPGSKLQITDRTITQGPVTISFSKLSGVGAQVYYDGSNYMLLLGFGCDIKFTVSGGCSLVSIKFDLDNNLRMVSGEPGRFDTQSNTWTALDSHPTSLTLHNGTDYSYFYKITVTYNSPATPLNFSYSQPAEGSSVAAFNSMKLYFNTSVSKVNNGKVLLTGSTFDGAKEMTASASGSTVTLSLSETISAEGDYTVSVPSAKFATSEGATNSPITVSFSIVPKRDTFTPTFVDPASGTTHGQLPKVIKLTFPSFVQAGTGTVKFKMGGEAQFAGTVSVNNKVATISHTHDVVDASTWTVEIPEKMFHNDFPADDVDYRWNPKMNLTYIVDGSQSAPVEVTPTAALSSEAIEKGGDELLLMIGNVLKANLIADAQPVFKYAEGEKAGTTVPFEGAILTTKSDLEFNVNTTGLLAGKYTLVIPKGSFVYEVGSNEIVNDVELTVPFEVLTNDYDTPTMKAARALLELTGVGYPSVDSDSYKALKALVDATDIPTDEALQAAIDALYNETAVMLPVVDNWYKIAGVNAAGKKLYLTFDETKTKVLLGTSVSNAAAFKVKSIEDGKLVFQTKEGFFLHIPMDLPNYVETSSDNLTVTESYVNKLTLAKFAAAGVTGVEPKDLYGLFTIYGSLGKKNDIEKFAYALLNYDAESIDTDPDMGLAFNASKSSAFVLTETTEPVDVTDYVYVSVGMRPAVIAKAGDEAILVVHGPTKTTIADATKIYYTYKTEDELNNTKVDFSGTILTATETANEFSVNTKDMKAGSYNIVMEEGAFAYEVPAGKVVKETLLTTSITIQSGTTPPEPSTTVTPTATLSSTMLEKAGDELFLAIGNVKKATLSSEAKPVFIYADGLQTGEEVSFQATILTRRTDTEFFVNTAGLRPGKYELLMPKGTFAYVVDEGKTLNDVDLTVFFEIRDNSGTVTDDFRYIYDAYIIFFPASRIRTSGYYKDVDLNEFIIYIDPSMYDGLVANPDKQVKIITTGGGVATTGRFVNYPEFAQDYGQEFAGTYAIKFVPDRPIEEGELDNWPGIYSYYCEPGTFGDASYGRWLAGDSEVTPSMCRVNPYLGAGSIMVYNSRATGISTVNSNENDVKTFFDLQGRPVTTPAKKGVYIVNGKKVVMK